MNPIQETIQRRKQEVLNLLEKRRREKQGETIKSEKPTLHEMLKAMAIEISEKEGNKHDS